MVKLDILIGSDYYDDIVKTDTIRIDSGLYLISSILGWMFSGRIPGASENGTDNVMFVQENVDVSRACWNLEAIGVRNEFDNLQDEEIIDNFNKTVRKDKERYEVSWPWKLSKYELLSNYPLVEGRLKSLVKNFKN